MIDDTKLRNPAVKTPIASGGFYIVNAKLSATLIAAGTARMAATSC